MNSKIKIKDKIIGEGKPCFIVAEIGSNHNNDLTQARLLIDWAVAAGCDAVKFQFFKSEKLYSRYAPSFEYLEHQNIQKLTKSIETPQKWIKKIAKHCEKRDTIFIASAFDFDSVDALEEYVDAYKIASFEITDLELIKHVSNKKKPTIISTGMANLGEIEDAITAIRSSLQKNIILLHCNSVYPTPPLIVNLNVIKTLRQAFGLPVGFSDHTLGTHIPLAAVSMGACMLEKHFTANKNYIGPDHSFAIMPDDFKKLILQIRDIENAMGNGVKKLSLLEKREMYEKARRSIHAKVDILKDTKITRDMLTIKRPGYGIKPKFIDIIIGRKTKKYIERDTWIQWDMI